MGQVGPVEWVSPAATAATDAPADAEDVLGHLDSAVDALIATGETAEVGTGTGPRPTTGP